MEKERVRINKECEADCVRDEANVKTMHNQKKETGEKLDTCETYTKIAKECQELKNLPGHLSQMHGYAEESGEIRRRITKHIHDY